MLISLEDQLNTKIFTVYAVLLILASSFFLLNGCGAKPTSLGSPILYTYIIGELDGITETTGEVHANALGHLNISMPTSYNPITHTFEVRNVPVNDTIYIKAIQYDASGTWASTSFSYGKVDITTEPVYCVITFESPASIDATCTVLSGFNMSGYGTYISKNNRLLLQVYSTSGGSIGSTFTINKLPKLLSGDSYVVTLSEKNSSGDVLSRYFYDIPVGASAFNMATPECPTTSFLVFPPNLTTFATGTPTFEWQSIPWADYYQLWVFDSSLINQKWYVSTTESRVSMPVDIASQIGSGTFVWQVEAHRNSTIETDVFCNGLLPGYVVP
jgi:hypothetical protein